MALFSIATLSTNYLARDRVVLGDKTELGEPPECDAVSRQFRAVVSDGKQIGWATV